MRIELFPPLNASLNAASAVLLTVGYICVKRRKYVAHATMMISALVTSVIFLACYLTYHRIHGVTRFPESSVKPLYLAILATHTILAAVIVPLILITVYRAVTRQWARHRKIARWTFPLWLYVSITGVVIYWMLYHLAPTLGH